MKFNYVLVTPAKNEDQYIEKTIYAVTSQTILPNKWVIVSDGSTDRTDMIVESYIKRFPFISLLKRKPGNNRNFGNKVYAIREGLHSLVQSRYDFIGMMDADVSFNSIFFESVLGEMSKNKRIGIAGGVLYERESNRWIRQHYSYEWSVAGPMQMFRRACYEDIGGYTPLPRGGVDMVAEAMARMHGWQVQTFSHIPMYHYRITGTAKGNVLSSYFRRGIFEYTNGYHPVFQFFRFFTWIPIYPYFIASLVRTCGYIYGFLNKEPLSVPKNVARYLRMEQLQRVKANLSKYFII
jgi:glycosyltransferase involved in cell wall biosynthesis